MKVKLTNKILIPVFAGIFIAFLFLAYSFPRFISVEKEKTVRIYKGNKVIEEIRLNDISKSYEIDLETNTVLLENDGVSMTYAHCPDKLCVHQGKITKAGESIVCLPNKIMIEILGTNDKVDAVAGAR